MSDLNLGKKIDPRRIPKRDATHVAVVPVVVSHWDFGEPLMPGQRVVIDNYRDRNEGDLGIPKVTSDSEGRQKVVGILDPFLDGPVNDGDVVWLFCMPGTIQSIRHDWSHPDIPLDDRDIMTLEEVSSAVIQSDGEEQLRRLMVAREYLHDHGIVADDLGDDSIIKLCSERWLLSFCAELGIELDRLTSTASACLNDGHTNNEWIHLNYDIPDIAYDKREQMWVHLGVYLDREIPDELSGSRLFSCSC